VDNQPTPTSSCALRTLPGRGAWRIFSLVVLLLSAAWVWLSAAPDGATTGGMIPAPRASFHLRGQAVLVNLWASWCTPCQAEMPAMQRVFEEYKDQGFTILAVNATQQDSQAAAIQFAAEKGLTFPILFDLDGSVARSYQMTALPSSFFILPDGTINEVIIGGPMAEALLQVRVEQLLEKR